MAKARKTTPAGRGGKGKSGKMVMVIGLLCLVPFSLPTLLVMFVGLLPTFAAAFAERGVNRYAWICVGGLNFSGLAPWLFKLWFGHHTLDYAYDLVTNLTVLLMSYGAACAGWALYLGLPPLVGMLMAATAQRRAIGLLATQKKLVEKWGDAVKTPDEHL
jgi:hypothetical protein